jgi:hypothetical protein
MAHFKTFMNNIIENISSNLTIKNKDSFDLLDKIIIIGEKTFYDNTYLCSLLNTNKIFRNKYIWEDSIKFKVLKDDYPIYDYSFKVIIIGDSGN